MALQTSGAISLNDIHLEAGGTTATLATINDSDIRDMIGKASGAQMSFSEWYGASSEPIFESNYAYAEDRVQADGKNTFPSGTAGTTEAWLVSMEVPNNGASSTDTFVSPWPARLGANPGSFFSEEWPADSSNYAGWEAGVIFNTPALNLAVGSQNYDFIRLRLYDTPTYVGGGATQAVNASVTTEQTLWSTCVISIEGQTSGETSDITLSRTSASSFTHAQGFTKANSLAAQFPPYHQWEYQYSGSNNTTAYNSALMQAMTPTWNNASFTVGELLYIKVAFY